MGKRIHQVIIGGEVMLLCMVVALLSTQAASANPPSNGVSYNKNGQVTVENALDNLYSKVNYGDAKANEILKGKKALVGGKEVVGTFTCPTLASLTPGNATAGDIDKGKIAWVNGNKIIGNRKIIVEPSEIINQLRLGDYIRYTTSNTSYTIPKDDTGHREDQNIDPSMMKLWRVIRKNKDGTVEIVSSYPSTEKVCFKNKVGYMKYIGTLNKIAQNYEDSRFTVDSRHVGYDSRKAVENLVEINTDGGNADYGYTTDISLLTLAFVPDKEQVDSWLASRNDISTVYENTNNGVRRLKQGTGGFYVGADQILPNNLSQDYTDSHFDYCRGVRPIVVLKSTLKITGGNGTETSPYTLGV